MRECVIAIGHLTPVYRPNFNLSPSQHISLVFKQNKEFTISKFVGPLIKDWFPLSQLRPRQRPISSQTKRLAGRMTAQPYNRFVSVSWLCVTETRLGEGGGTGDCGVSRHRERACGQIFDIMSTFKKTDS